MKIIKSLLKKNADPYIALMIYCSTPLHNGFSFSDLLMNRQLHTTSPILEGQLQPPYQNTVLSVRRDNEKAKSKKIFVIEQIATLDPLLPGQVWMLGRRDSGVIVSELLSPRS